METLEERIKAGIRDVPDFPEEGVIFKDITPLLNCPELFHEVIEHFRARYEGRDIDHVVAIESRGFLFGAPLAYAMGVGLSLVRKPNKLPHKTFGVDYALEYGTDRVEMHVDGVDDDSRVVVVDDVLATGGTAAATCELVERCGASVVECAFLIELDFLNGREKLEGHEVHSLAVY
ncbi:adenine phosphoribosyltransferase [Persicimonas caeni]|uniref:Adenine phosphoribosyltransferase n=1 Tax=Persicimonas caeni TaxID=2292766 RepID=A0A4Y6Q0M3_PERCE|nr:adenine phosphoribosyltransferase [Persicimonas caeni]QDG54131.1 adenine phosphoribosyltransferase [Persicimonas caeni]QED35352.1 adenine phosphoribosyltransferase [Persicimonas caeni]